MTTREYDAILRQIRKTNGHIFSVTFSRRHDKLDKATGTVLEKAGTPRCMQARLGVTKGVKGTSKVDRRQQDRSNRLLTVYEMPSGGFKSIPVDQIIDITL